MADLEAAKQDLVSANRILGHEGILDAYGHVSIRHPEDPQRFLLSRARSPEVVEVDDLVEFNLDGSPVKPESRPLYIERFIHGAAYEARPDVSAVCHNHTLSILPFGISKAVGLRPVIHSARFLSGEVPVWDIADEFGTETDLLVRNIEEGRSLSRALGSGAIALMRGHGSVVAGSEVSQLVQWCVGMDRNARVQLMATQLGDFLPLHPGESATSFVAGADNRAWEYFRRRAGRE